MDSFEYHLSSFHFTRFGSIVGKKQHRGGDLLLRSEQKERLYQSTTMDFQMFLQLLQPSAAQLGSSSPPHFIYESFLQSLSDDIVNFTLGKDVGLKVATCNPPTFGNCSTCGRHGRPTNLVREHRKHHQ